MSTIENVFSVFYKKKYSPSSQDKYTYTYINTCHDINLNDPTSLNRNSQSRSKQMIPESGIRVLLVMTCGRWPCVGVSLVVLVLMEAGPATTGCSQRHTIAERQRVIYSVLTSYHSASLHTHWYFRITEKSTSPRTRLPRSVSDVRIRLGMMLCVLAIWEHGPRVGVPSTG